VTWSIFFCFALATLSVFALTSSQPKYFPVKILLPDTQEENALILERRVREALVKHDFGVDPDLDFSFSTTSFKAVETPEECVARADKLLKD